MTIFRRAPAGLVASGVFFLGLFYAAGTVTYAAPINNELMLVNAVLIGWGVAVQLNCIGEVNRFSAWRALAAILLMIATLTVLILLVAYFAGGLSHSAVAIA